MHVTKKWEPITTDKLPNLQKAIEEINSWEIHKLSIKLTVEDNRNLIEILDDTEELYYGGFRFEKTLDKLNEALKLDTDDCAYFDCICPGRWLADYSESYLYTVDDVQSHISLAMSEAMCNYMISNGIKYNWTDELRDRCDKLELSKEFMDFFNDLIKNSRKETI